MFDKLKDFFSGDASLQVDSGGEPTKRDLQIATGVLLLEMAGADEDFAPEEVQAAFRTMEQQFDIKDMETLELMEEAQKAREDQGKIDAFIAALNTNFNDKQKLLVLAMVWKVVLADEVVEKYEQRFASELRQRLQLSREQAEEAKQMVLEGKV